jgi:hypothetical protein
MGRSIAVGMGLWSSHAPMRWVIGAEPFAGSVATSAAGVELLCRQGSRSSALDPRRQGKSAKLSQLAKNGTSPVQALAVSQIGKEIEAPASA